MGPRETRGARMRSVTPRLPRVSEKTEQAHIVQLLRSLGGKVYVLGTRRRSADYQGTCQTSGLPDLEAFLPPSPGLCRHAHPSPHGWLLVKIEVKAVDGRLRPEQATYREVCEWARVAHIVGDLDAVIAWLCAHGYVKAEQFSHERQPKE